MHFAIKYATTAKKMSVTSNGTYNGSVMDLCLLELSLSPLRLAFTDYCNSLLKGNTLFAEDGLRIS